MNSNKIWLPLVAGATTALVCAMPAHADVLGRLRIVVRNIDTEKPITGAQVSVKDSSGVRPDTSLTPSESGEVTTAPIENRAFSVSVSASGFETQTRSVIVVADTTTDVIFDLEPAEQTIKITGQRTPLRPQTPTNSTNRSADFSSKYPVTAGNPQSLQGLIASTPGIALDSNNQAHPRGEHTQTSVYIGGFQLGGALAGRFGPLIVPDAIENVDVQTGSFSPEYGSETAAILNTTIRQGPIRQFFNVQGGGGSFATRQGSLSFGGQLGAPLLSRKNADATTEASTNPDGTATPTESGPIARRFRYFLNSTMRSTNNALESPQPDRQTANNDGRAQSYLGRFDYLPSDRDTFTLTLNSAPARTGVANRTGLSDNYAGVGQGYGYGGAVSREDALASGNPFLSTTQDAAGQDINQRDNNRFGVLQYRHDFSDKLTSLFSVGGSRSSLDVTNSNPGVYQDLSTLSSRPDAAIEFSPTVSRSSRNNQFGGSLSYASDGHTFKAGFSNDSQRGDESYNLIPGSQLALNALYSAAPQLAGYVDGGSNNLGTPQVDGNGEAVLDANGNQVYLLNSGTTTLPTVNVNRRGTYRAFYLQDTWRVNSRFTANYGLRFDQFSRTETSGSTPFSLKKNQLSPRVNLSYGLGSGLLARASYNRLFIQPPVSQGAAVGTFAQPETLNQYETSIEKSFSSRQTVKLAYYYKQIQNQLDIALLVPGSQIGIFSAVNLVNSGVHGVELSYDLAPRNGVGLGGYVSLARAVAKFTDPEEGTDYNDHDQRYTLSTGVSYTLPNGAFASTSIYYGSGAASSAIAGDGSLGFTGSREARTKVDLRLSSGPKLFGGHGGLNLDVDNLLNDRSLINFGSDFSGTRFQQGRRVVLSAFANF
ncbi:TonB-dependent receptor [bacterium]|nr:MAG: TonB-dependent receptor [bacterium]